jgi:AcrR family transcriptional regulator
VSETIDGPRARYRRQVRAEVLEHAWAQIAEAGASALSLKAIATGMGMTGPALYRYFAGRDELLTELILTAYADLADVIENAAAHSAATDPTARRATSPQQRLEDLAQALRRWALTNPQRYLLLYGTPVPGYDAPPEATALARRIFTPVHDAFTADGRGRRTRRSAPDAFTASVTFWTRLHGVLSLELAGHFTGMDIDPARLYASEAHSVITGGR